MAVKLKKQAGRIKSMDAPAHASDGKREGSPPVYDDGPKMVCTSCGRPKLPNWIGTNYCMDIACSGRYVLA